MSSSHSGTLARNGERNVGHESSSVTVEQTLDDAHRLLRQGKVDDAIEVYAEVLEERSDDWPAANRLGDLYVQAERLDEAVEQFTRVAQYLWERGRFPKAAALYKKVLKLRPEDESARDQLSDIALRQGFLVDALAHLTTIVDHRRAAGDDEGSDRGGTTDGPVATARGRGRRYGGSTLACTGATGPDRRGGA